MNIDLPLSPEMAQIQALDNQDNIQIQILTTVPTDAEVGKALKAVLKDLWSPRDTIQDYREVHFFLMSKGKFNVPDDPYTDCAVWVEFTDICERTPATQHLVSLLKGWKG
jgi:hypothetical protein